MFLITYSDVLLSLSNFFLFFFFIGDNIIYIIIISGAAAGGFVCLFFAILVSIYYCKKEGQRDRTPISLFGNYVEVEVEVGIVIEAVDVTLITEIPLNRTYYTAEPIGNGIERIVRSDAPILNISTVLATSSSSVSVSVSGSPSSYYLRSELS